MGIVFFRTLIIYVALLAAMRLMGKRQLGELELSELVITVLISEIAAHPLQDIGIPLMNGLLPIIILLCCELIISGIILKSNKAKEILCGKPSFLIVNGVIDQKQMLKNRFTPDELAEELRTQSILDISLIKFAILETDGRLNIVLFPSERPVTAGQMSINADDSGYPMIIINNGKLIKENLYLCGKNGNWLNKELSERNVKSIKDVYLMSLNEAGQIYFAKAEDKQ
ncbi:MAG: DUF421 domain-containing protein [Oscillospiraceae bacterium]|nr:DUF421 domain-containing protein [Oscillospiraceae bacterium]